MEVDLFQSRRGQHITVLLWARTRFSFMRISSMATCSRDYWLIDIIMRIMDLFKVIFSGLYHGKSPSNDDHLGEQFLLFPGSLWYKSKTYVDMLWACSVKVAGRLQDFVFLPNSAPRTLWGQTYFVLIRDSIPCLTFLDNIRTPFFVDGLQRPWKKGVKHGFSRVSRAALGH